MWKDSEAEIDFLDFDYLIGVLKDIIDNEELLPATIGVYGDWGSGKSSLIKLAINDFENDKNIVCLNFNAWLFESYEDAKASLLGSILDKICEEKKFEETGVTKKKRNYIQFESKLGTEKERDLHKIEGARLKGQPQKRQEEVIISKRKRKEYLDNYQYLETKELNQSKPAIVIHERLGDIIGGVYEETTVQRVRGGSYDRNRGSATSSNAR